jgi:hypothetical protein
MESLPNDPHPVYDQLVNDYIFHTEEHIYHMMFWQIL